MRILVVAPKNKTIYNFRGDLIKDLVDLGHQVYVVGNSTLFKNEIEKLGVKKLYVVEQSNYKINFMQSIRFVKKLQNILNEIKPDILFSYTSKIILLTCISVNKNSRVKHVSMFTGLGRIHTKSQLKFRILKFIMKYVYRLYLKKSDSIIFQNKDDMNYFLSNNIIKSSKALLVNGSGVNTIHYSFKEIYNFNTYTFIGRLMEEKGFHVFLKSIKEIYRRGYKNYRFRIVGKMSTRKGNIKSLFNELVDSNAIEYIDEVKDIRPQLYETTYLVLPTFYGEGIPRVILESLSCGRPVITTDWPGCRDSVINKHNGYLVKPKSEIELANVIIESSQNKDDILFQSKNARLMAISKYEVKLVNLKMIEYMGVK